MNVSFAKNIIKPLNHISKICGIAWSPNGMILAIACGDRKIYLFDEQGNYKESFSTKEYSKENYEFIQILFNQESTKLAIAQSDNVIFIYMLDLNLGDHKKMINKIELSEKPKCMVWSKTNIKLIYFGSVDGIIRVCSDDKTTCNILYKHQSPCVSISSSLDGKYIISGHKDCAILIYEIETSVHEKLCTHICIPSCLAWGTSSSILVAGNNYKVVIYDNKGKMIQDFDYTNDDNIKEFGCCAISNSGEAIALGNTDCFYIYFYKK